MMRLVQVQRYLRLQVYKVQQLYSIGPAHRCFMSLIGFYSWVRVFNAINSLDNALSLIVSTYCHAIRPELKVTMFELVVSAATFK
jgi:hypothetical protein